MTILEMKGINKSFGNLKALDDVSIELEQSEVRGLMGINGAGKSTLMKILSGVYQLDSGEVLVNGVPVVIDSPDVAQKQGITIVHQEFSLIPHLSVAENLFISRLPVKNKTLKTLNRSQMVKESYEALELVGLDIDPNTRISDLSIGKQQLIEIAKAITLKNPKIIIFDEPTSALSSSEINNLFTVIERLKATGIGIIYITHRLGEFEKICDSTTVLRDGKLIGTYRKHEKNLKELIDLMLGESSSAHESSTGNADYETPVLVLDNVAGENVPGPISFKLHKGEILGLVGQMGSGRSEVLRSIIGLDTVEAGNVLIFGEPLSGSTGKRIQGGVGYVAENRKKEGLLPTRQINENISISVLHQLSKFNFMSRKKEKELFNETVERTELSPNDPNLLITQLSGGNQQKVMIGRWLGLENLQILLLDEPTRGVDVGAKYKIYTILKQLASQGVAILVASSDLEEILMICDRIVRLHHGKTEQECNTKELDLNKLTLLISEEKSSKDCQSIGQ